jgi:chromosome segregation ATPase
MSGIDEIRADIVDTNAKLKKAETKLEQLEEAEQKDETKIQQCREDVLDLRNLLIEQQRKENLLLASQGEFQLLSLHISRSNPIPSTYMMTHNA